jgi:hypothetical protein
MIRAGVLRLILASCGLFLASEPPVKWPLRATVTELHGRHVAFQAITLGGDLIVQVGQHSKFAFPGQPVSELNPLSRGDTLRATTPASFPLDLRKGSVVFFTSSRDSIRIAVGRTPLGSVDSVTGSGRRLTLRLTEGTVVVSAR